MTEKQYWTRVKKQANQKRGYIASLLRRYGMTLLDYALLAADQENACAICRRPVSDLSPYVQYQRSRPWVVDHDHVSGRVRGLLCDGCNAGLGCFGDNPEHLRSAIHYLLGAAV